MSVALEIKWHRPAIVDADRLEELSKMDLYICISNGNPYARRRTTKASPVGETWLHRIIANCPKGMVTHHKNGNTMDDRLANLAIMTKEAHSTLHNKRRKTELLPNPTKEPCHSTAK